MVELSMMAQLPCVCGHERRQHSIHRDKCLKASESGEICPCEFFKFHPNTEYFVLHSELLVVAKSLNARWPEITQKIVEILRADRDSLPQEGLDELFDLISGKGKFSFWGNGIQTYPNGDENKVKLHGGCLELEKRGLIFRKIDTEDHVLWMPKQLNVEK